MASRVASGSHSPVSSNAFSPARTSFQTSRRVPPYAFSTAASNTRTDACQMSGPVPSPMMNGMMGASGTERRPSCIVIVWPSGIVGVGDWVMR